jgi:catechol O-methyltransferase
MIGVPLALFALTAAAGIVALLAVPLAPSVWWPLVAATAIAALLALHELLGRPLPFLRWSVLRMMLGRKTLTRDWQVGDGREEGAARYVIAHARPGDPADAIRAIDTYAREKSFLINVGDEKGAILDAVIDRERPGTVLELGAYVGYSALRIASRLAAGGRLVSIELMEANAAIARRIVQHAGLTDRVTFVVGHLGDAGSTLAHLTERCGLGPGGVDVVFIDHAKDAYLPDLRRLLAAGLLHPGSVVVADNVRYPGAPEYRTYMEAEEGRTWRTTAHETHAEYQSIIKDVILESRLL